ncbi:recombination protein 2 [[Haemophilus] ducreyi]|nr:recombination protein 2 [[Haemophilus] ducreyi]
MLYGIFYAKSKWFWWQSAGLILVSVLIHLFIFSSKKIEWITFDVGQGLAQAFVYQQNGQNKAIFYDTGVSWGASGNSMASLEILPYLRRHNIEVEAIFLSHDDRDHAGGIPDLLAAYPNARLISSSAMPYANKMPEACIAGKQWQFNQLIFRAIYPTKLTTRSKNADSCIIIVDIDRFRILLTGDATAQQERTITPSLTRIDFLQVPHHGSKTSSSQALLAKIKPHLAIASVGRWNPWRMPHPRVVERFEQYNIPLVTTATDGMIKVIFEHNTWEVITNRNKFSAWYRQLYATSAKQ